MASRKPNMESSIYLGEEGRWHGRVTMGIKSDGSPDRRHRSGRTEAEVKRKVKALEKLRDAGRAPKAGRIPTVEQWMSAYLDTIAVNKLKPRSLDDYWSKTRNDIVPGVGKHRLDRLRPEHLDQMYADMVRAGHAPSHVLKVHRILSRALKIAHRRELVGRNVATLIDPPTVEEEEITPFTQEEARALLEAAAKRPTALRWAIGVGLGIRQGESLGLRWSYVDLEAGHLKTWWQLQRLTWRHGVNMQVVTDQAGRLLWISPARPGRSHDLTAARAHRIIRICERQGVSILADRAYIGASSWVTTPLRRPPGVSSPRPSKPSTGRCPRHGRRSSAASHG
jgi:integrase